MVNVDEQVANMVGTPAVIKRRPPETREQRLAKIRGISEEERQRRLEVIRRTGVGTETPGVKRIPSTTEERVAKIAGDLSPEITTTQVLTRRPKLAAPDVAPTITPEVSRPKQFVVQTTPAGQFLIVETAKGKKFIPGIVPEITKQTEEIVARGETPEGFNVVVARFLESPEGKKFVGESGLTKEELVKISRSEEITQALQEDIESGRLESALRKRALEGDIGAAVTLAGRELIIGRQVARLVGDEKAAAREEAEFLAGLQTAAERRDPIAFTGTALGETITGQLGVGIASGVGIGAAGIVAATALKGTKVAQVASKLPLIAKATKFLAKPAVQKGLVVGAIGGLEAVKVGGAIVRGEPAAKIGTEIAKDVLFLGGTVFGVKEGIAIATKPVSPGKIDFVSKVTGKQFQTGVPTRIVGKVKTKAILTAPRTRAEALLRKSPKEVAFGVKEGFLARLEGEEVATLFLTPGKPVAARPTVTRTIAEFEPTTPLGITTRRIVVGTGKDTILIGTSITKPTRAFQTFGGKVVKGKEVSALVETAPVPGRMVAVSKVETKLFVPEAPGPPPRIPKAPPAVPKTPEDVLKIALKRVEDVKDVSRVTTVGEEQVLLVTPKPKPPAIKPAQVGALQDITRQRTSEILRSQYDKLYDTAGDEVSGGFVGPSAKEITKVPKVDVGKIKPTLDLPAEKIKSKEELQLKPIVKTDVLTGEEFALKIPAILKTVAPPREVVTQIPGLAITSITATTPKVTERVIPIFRTTTISAPRFRLPPIGGFPFLGLPPLRAGGGGTLSSGKLKLGSIRKTKISTRRKKVERNIGFLSEGISKSLYGKATLPKEKAARGEVIFKPSAELKKRGINVGGFLLKGGFLAKGGLFGEKKKAKKKRGKGLGLFD